MLNQDKIEQVQDSFAKLVPRSAILALDFYEKLFELRPDFRALFPENMETQRSKLVVTLATVIQSLHEIDTVIEEVRKLGQRHVGYKVKAEDYDPVGEALIFALQKNLGSTWSDDLQEAWVTAYQTLSNVMIEAASAIKAA